MAAVPAPTEIFDENKAPITTIYDVDGNKISPYMFLDSKNVTLTIEDHIQGLLDAQAGKFFDCIPDLCEDWDVIKTNSEENMHLLSEIQCF